MFVAADAVVRAVMIGLACASVATRTVWLAKTMELRAAKRRTRMGLTTLLDARSVADGVRRGMIEGPARELLAAAVAELDQFVDTLSPAGVKERIASRLERIRTPGT